jgi:phosphatidylglycerophosphatase C
MNQVIAAFDFDGTITYRDTLLPFLKNVQGSFSTIKSLGMLLPCFIKFEIGQMTRAEVKEEILQQFLKGVPEETLCELGKRFASEYIPSKVKPEAIKRIQWHQRQGHRCVLVSANVEFHLIPWAKSVGIDDVIATRCEVSQGVLTGHLLGNNCWGKEKLNRLSELVGSRDSYVLYAYGDSKGDYELLQAADYSFFNPQF